jgi:hypothetical protein
MIQVLKVYIPEGGYKKDILQGDGLSCTCVDVAPDLLMSVFENFIFISDI